ncbi:GTPase HflX [Mollicutes bacterium LVI A0039]|nr:GTPase HflX [Mollicutes bacterium LVI A0039]
MQAILVSAIYQKDQNTEYYLEETTNLADALGIEIVATFTQRVDKRNNATYVHEGKVQEIADYLDEHDIDIVIIQEEITAAMERNLTEKWKIKVIDRTNLILDIFYSNAQSKLAKTQIEIARLEYNLTKVIGSYSNLEKQGSSAVSRSSGESKAELDKRRIRDQIIRLKRNLAAQKQVRDSKRTNRRNSTESIVSLAGYTNVGKSTLLNSLTDSERQILAKDQLFATLDTSVRRVEQKKYGNYLFIDTVGFVSNLPHHLVEAFASTFEEILESDIILHLHDASDPHMEIHHRIVTDTLKTLHADDIPVIDVYNKADLTEKVFDGIMISSLNKTGYDQLFTTINDKLNERKQLSHFFFDYTHMKEYNFFKQNFKLETEDIDDTGIHISLYTDESTVSRYQQFIKE